MPEREFRKIIITITVIIAAMLQLIDSTIVNVSLPQIMGNLGATLDEVGWVVTAYAVANVIVLPMSGWLGERFGRKNYFTASIIIFTTASFFCGHAHSLDELIVFRIIQGFAGGGIMAVAQAILLEAWPPEEVGLATAIFGLGAVVGPTIGPTLGGYITDHFSWPWIFYVNIPVGALATFLSVTFVRRTPATGKGRPVDWWGIAFLSIAVGSLQIVLEKGEREDWFATTYIEVLSFVAIIGAIAFIWREMIAREPIVDLKIFRFRSFSLGMFTSFIYGLGLYGSVFVFPVLCQNILGFTAEQTGLLLLPGGIATIFMMPAVGSMLKNRVPAQFISTVGMIVFFIFCMMMQKRTTAQVGNEDFFWPLIIRGLGMGMLFVPITTLAVQDLRGKDIGQGTGLNNMGRQLGGSFGIALITTFIDRRMAYHRDILINHINPYNSNFIERFNMLWHGFMSKGYDFLQARQMAYQAMDGMLMKQAALLTYADVFWIVGVFFLCIIPLLYFQKFNRGQTAEGGHLVME